MPDHGAIAVDYTWQYYEVSSIAMMPLAVAIDSTRYDDYGLQTIESIQVLPPATHSISGTVMDAASAGAARLIRAYRSIDGRFLGAVESDPDAGGAFMLQVPPGEVFVVMSGEPDKNDLIFAGVQPI